MFFSEASLTAEPRPRRRGHRGVARQGPHLRRPPAAAERRAVEDWEDREQTLFRSTEFGDDVDRPLMKSDGGYTYFASDIAYHKDKLDRGFASLVDVWGADHGGYVKRLRAAVGRCPTAASISRSGSASSCG